MPDGAPPVPVGQRFNSNLHQTRPIAEVVRPGAGRGVIRRAWPRSRARSPARRGSALCSKDGAVELGKEPVRALGQIRF